MTAPLDIGLEHTDPTLGLGQEDMFDLKDTEEGLRRRGGISVLVRQGGDIVINNDKEDEDSNGDEFLDSEEERQKKITGLEAELDGLYGAYQERMRERDAKFKVNESRKRNAEREEWHGIQQQASGDDVESDEGGWDRMEEAKGEVAGESSSDESDADCGNTAPPVAGRKRRRAMDEREDQKRPRLVTKVGEQVPQPSEAARVWFSQDIFACINGIDDIEDDKDMTDLAMNEESHGDDTGWQDEVNDFLLQFIVLSTDNISGLNKHRRER